MNSAISGLIALTMLIILSACASGGGSPDPMLDSVGVPAAPRNTVLNELSFEHPSEPLGVDETFNLAVAVLSVTGDGSGAEIFNGTQSSFFGEGAQMQYDSENNTFTFDINMTNLLHEGQPVDDIVINETFGPVLLTNPVDDGRFEHGVTAILLAAQTNQFGVDPDFIKSDAGIADAFLSSLGYAFSLHTPAGSLTRYDNIASDFGSVTTVADPDDPTVTLIGTVTYGFLDELIAYDPSAFGLDGIVPQGSLSAAQGYLLDLINQPLASYTDLVDLALAIDITGSGNGDFGLLPDLIALYPDQFQVDTAVEANPGAVQFFLEVLESFGSTTSTVESILAIIDNISSDIQSEDFFVYTENGIFFFQKKLSTAGVTTLEVGVNGLQVANAQGGTDYVYTVFGERTLSDEMPTTGTATYVGSLIGSLLFQNRVESLRGGINAEIDFARSTMNMTMEADIATLGLDGETIFLDYDIFTGTGDINDTTFTGDLQAQEETSLIGSFTGAFFGVRGREIGGTFEFSNHEVAGTGGFVAVDEENDNTD